MLKSPDQTPSIIYCKAADNMFENSTFTGALISQGVIALTVTHYRRACCKNQLYIAVIIQDKFPLNN
jgi:hypothetical protein